MNKARTHTHIAHLSSHSFITFYVRAYCSERFAQPLCVNTGCVRVCALSFKRIVTIRRYFEGKSKLNVLDASVHKSIDADSR